MTQVGFFENDNTVHDLRWPSPGQCDWIQKNVLNVVFCYTIDILAVDMNDLHYLHKEKHEIMLKYRAEAK